MKEKNYESIIDNIMEQEDRLNDWEAGFISSIYNQTYPLQYDQKEKILEINRKIHSGR